MNLPSKAKYETWIPMLILLSFFVITLSAHNTYAQTEDENKKYLPYENEEIGMNLEYPADWKLVDNIPNVPFVVRFWAPGASGLISMDHVYRDTRISPEVIAESHVKRWENRGDFVTSVESNALLISGYPAWQLTYSGITHELRPYTFSKVFVVADNSRYIFSYHGGQYSEYLTIFNSIVDSVQINPVESRNISNEYTETSSSSAHIPDWVEYNIRLWTGGQIDDQTMILAIQFLADRGIVTMPSMKEIDTYKIAHGNDPEIHAHIKQNAWAWAESDLRPDNFLKGIGYLTSLNSQDESSSDSKYPEDCPASFSPRCFTGKITEVIDGDTIRVDEITIHLTLVSTPELDESGGLEAKTVVERICPIGADALVDQDNLPQSDEFTADVPVLAVVYCNGHNINAILVHRELGSFDNIYCHASEFANELWAKEGCKETELN